MLELCRRSRPRAGVRGQKSNCLGSTMRQRYCPLPSYPQDRSRRDEKPANRPTARQTKGLSSERETRNSSSKSNDQSVNVYENKGPLWKTWAQSCNVIENKGTYRCNPGILLKAKELLRENDIDNPRPADWPKPPSQDTLAAAWNEVRRVATFKRQCYDSPASRLADLACVTAPFDREERMQRRIMFLAIFAAVLAMSTSVALAKGQAAATAAPPAQTTAIAATLTTEHFDPAAATNAPVFPF